MTDDLKTLSPPEKKIAAKVLYDMGWSSRQIERWIAMDNVSVIRASELPTPDELKQFETDFRLAISAEKQRGIALGVKRLNELIPKERRIDSLVKGLEYLEGKGTAQVLQQFNNNGNTFVIQVTKDEEEFNRLTSEPVADISGQQQE